MSKSTQLIAFVGLLSVLGIALLMASLKAYLKFNTRDAVECFVGFVIFLVSVIFALMHTQYELGPLLAVVGVVCIIMSLIWMEYFSGYRPFYVDVVGLCVMLLGVVSFLFSLVKMQ